MERTMANESGRHERAVEQEIAWVRRIVLDALRPWRVRVWLFGSWARGDAELLSDIDVAIWPEEKLPVGLLAELRERLEEAPIVREVDLVDLRFADDTLRKAVIREGGCVARLKERLAVAERALRRLEEVLQQGAEDAVVRDAATLRFALGFEAVWKAAQRYLREVEGVHVASPKAVVRACAQVGVLKEEDARLALTMVDHRNLTSHTYNEALAKEIDAALGGYARLLRRWLANLREGMRND